MRELANELKCGNCRWEHYYEPEVAGRCDNCEAVLDHVGWDSGDVRDVRAATLADADAELARALADPLSLASPGGANLTRPLWETLVKIEVPLAQEVPLVIVQRAHALTRHQLRHRRERLREALRELPRMCAAPGCEELLPRGLRLDAAYCSGRCRVSQHRRVRAASSA